MAAARLLVKTDEHGRHCTTNANPQFPLCLISVKGNGKAPALKMALKISPTSTIIAVIIQAFLVRMTLES